MNKTLNNKIGNTPLVEAVNLQKKYGLKSRIYLKLENKNLTGSSKDRLVYHILKTYKDQGLIKEGSTVIEPTSGNTGIALAKIVELYNLHAIIVMPDTMSKERIKMIEDYGGKVVLTEGCKGMQGSIDKANELLKEIKDSITLDQFNNPLGAMAHYTTTGKEIYESLPQINTFIACIGTGATFTGTSKYLKEQNKQIKCIGVEPSNSPVITKGISGHHLIQGIGAGFIPSILDLKLIDDLYTISDEEAYYYTKELYLVESIKAGISSGAALAAAIFYAKDHPNESIVVIIPDDGNRYLSTGVYS